MDNCLVTKLKASVSNPDLPIFETMQQFTLDAIAASGNSSMTDAQKWALNKFFYQIGAIGNTALWQKVKALAIPMISNDNLSKAALNYVDNTVIATASGQFSNHGYYDGIVNIAKYSGNRKGIGIVAFSTVTADIAVTTPSTIAGVLDSDYIQCYKNNSQNSDYFNYQGTQKIVQHTAIDGFNITGDQDNLYFTSMVNGNIILIETKEAVITDSTLSSKNIIMNGFESFPIGIVFVTFGLTKEEGAKLLSACTAFRNAYLG